jgi:hypothetical protein
MTNAGFTLGTPLGPDSWSLYASARVDLRYVRIWPWLEFIRRSSDQYHFVDYGPITRVMTGNEETRFRAGARVEAMPWRSVRLDARVLYEHVNDFAFVPSEKRDNGGMEFSITWTPNMTVP